MNKKGNVFDIIFYIGLIFSVAITILIAGVIMNQFNTNLQSMDNSTINDHSKQVFSDQNNRYSGLFDNVLFMITIGLMIVTAISSFFIRSHPIFFFVSIIALAITIVFAAILSNAYNEFSTNPELSGVASQLPKINYIMNNLPLIVIVFGGIIFLILFGKRGFEGGGGVV